TVGVWKLGDSSIGVGALTWLFRLPIHALIMALAVKDPYLILYPTLAAFSAFLLWAGTRIAPDPEFSYTRALLITLPAGILLTVLLWLTSKYVIVPNLQSWGPNISTLILLAVTLIGDFGLIVVGLILIGRVPVVQALVSAAYRIALLLHFSAL